MKINLNKIDLEDLEASPKFQQIKVKSDIKDADNTNVTKKYPHDKKNKPKRGKD